MGCGECHTLEIYGKWLKGQSIKSLVARVHELDNRTSAIAIAQSVVKAPQGLTLEDIGL